MATVLAGKYELVRPLGSGGMGVVYEARHTALRDRRVAIKYLLPQFRDEPAVAERFLREARAAASITHPGIVRVLDVEHDAVLGPMVVLELLEGRSLDAVARAGPTPWPLACQLVASALDGVAAAHAGGVVHRDLKPANLFMVRGDGERTRVKVLDFGLARFATPSVALTEPGAFMGTPRYASPEQRVDAATAGAPSDVYSMGVTLLELLAGRPAKLGSDAGQRAGELATLGSHGVPDAVAAVVATSIEPSPAARFATASAMRAALIDALAAAGHGADAPWLDEPERASEPSRGSESTTADADEPGRGATWNDVVRAPRPIEPPVSAPSPAPGTTVVERAEATSAPRAPSALAATPSQTERARRALAPWFARLRTALTVTGVLTVLLMAAVCLFHDRRVRRGEVAAASAPHGAPGASLACPVFDGASITRAPGYRLGAAAASIACDRARWILGGRLDATLSPAELTGVGTRPGGEGTTDPWHDADVRETALAAARTRAALVLDGVVERLGEDDAAAVYRVTLTLETPGGRALDHAQASHARLGEAVARAMDPLVARQQLRASSVLDASVARAVPYATVAEALASTDLARSVEEGARDDATCAAVERERVSLGPAWPALRRLCPARAVQTAPAAEPPAVDASSAGAFARTAIARALFDPAADPGALADQAHALLEHETHTLAAAELSYAEGVLRARNHEPDAAHDLLRSAVEVAPREQRYFRALVGVFGIPSGARDDLLAYAARFPDAPVAWSAPHTGAARERNLRTAVALAPHDPRYASMLAHALLENQRGEQARALADALERDHDPFELPAVELARVATAVIAGHFGDALAHARAAFDGATSVACAGDLEDRDADAMYTALELATVLGRTREVADAFAATVLDAVPPRLDRACPYGAELLAVDCALASPRVAVRCFDRLHAFADATVRAALPEHGNALVAGAEAYARGEPSAAIALWRPIAGNAQVCMLLAPAYDRAGLDALGNDCDRGDVASHGELRGVDMAYVRSAERAARRGDHAEATRLAQAVVDAWAGVDPPVPWLAPMRALLAGARH